MEFIFITWFLLAIIVAVAANTRNRNPVGWFLLACVLSPLVAGLFVLALPAKPPRDPLADIPVWDTARRAQGERKLAEERAKREMEGVFLPDGVYAGIPYKVLEGGAIEALMSGNRIRFRDLEMFKASADGGNA